MSIQNKVRTNTTPTLTELNVGFRQVASSAQINEASQAILNDVLDLFNHSNQLEEDIEYVRHILTAENAFLRYRLSELEGALAKLSQSFLEITRRQEIRTKLIFPDEMYTDNTIRDAEIDLDAMCVTMKPTKRISKVNLYDEALGTTYVPPSLQLTYGANTSQAGQDVISIDDNGPENAFDGDMCTYWVRRHVCEPYCQEVFCELIVGLPEDVLTTQNINTIVINPYPVDSVDIMSVEVKVNGNWQLIPGFETHARSTLEEYSDIFGNKTEESFICDASNLKFNFNELNANELRIKLRQRNYIRKENGRKEFFLGLKSLEVYQNLYHDEYNTFNAMVEFKETDRIISIEDMEIILNNPNEVRYNTIQFEYYTVDEEGDLHKIPQTAPFNLDGHKMVIKFKMHESSVSPNIRQIRIKYQTI